MSLYDNTIGQLILLTESPERKKEVEEIEKQEIEDIKQMISEFETKITQPIKKNKFALQEPTEEKNNKDLEDKALSNIIDLYTKIVDKSGQFAKFEKEIKESSKKDISKGKSFISISRQFLPVRKKCFLQLLTAYYDETDSNWTFRSY